MSDQEEFDVFGEQTEEEKKAQAELAAKNAEKKEGEKKPKATKSTIVLDVKPWEAETDMKALEAAVRALQFDGLIWGRSELKEVGYGVKKLQIQIVVEDEKVMWDDVEEQILALEEYVQSCDIQAWNKI